MKMRSLSCFALSALFLVGCDDGGSSSSPPTAPGPVGGIPNPPEPVMFEVTTTNLSAGQPFSPVAVIAHDSQYRLFELGAPASLGLEILAEGGDNSTLIAEAEDASGVFATSSGAGPIGPGGSGSQTFTVDATELAELELSVITMLVNTNDAITAVRSVNLASLAAGEMMQLRTISYDSGTEANTEAAGTMPGPADGGEGFNAARDDIADEVRGHGGVVTSSDGLSTSVLTDVNRWDNPSAAISIRRLP